MRATLVQLWRWIVTPLPRVTKPTIGSGGAGLQQRASTVISRSTPTTRMPLPAPAALLCRARPGSGSAAGDRGRLHDRLDRGLDLPRVDLVAADGGEELVRALEAGLRGDRVEIDRRRAGARELALDDRAAVRERLLVLLLP